MEALVGQGASVVQEAFAAALWQYQVETKLIPNICKRGWLPKTYWLYVTHYNFKDIKA